jgi:hypothetical protein
LSCRIGKNGIHGRERPSTASSFFRCGDGQLAEMLRFEAMRAADAASATSRRPFRAYAIDSKSNGLFRAGMSFLRQGGYRALHRCAPPSIDIVRETFMHRPFVFWPCVCLSVLMAAACTDKSPTPVGAAGSSPAGAATGATAVATAPTVAARKHPKACDMVTAAEMSAILGGPVVAAAGGNDRPPSSTECIYSPADGSNPANAELPNGSSTPYAELQVDWGAGDAPALDTAAGLLNSAAPIGAVNPLQGLGDRAYKVTAFQVFISTRGDLMMIRFLPKTKEVDAKARRIYEISQGRI